MPDVSPVKSSVVPEGTATFERTMVAHEALDLLAAEAPDDPEKVQDALRNHQVSSLFLYREDVDIGEIFLVP